MMESESNSNPKAPLLIGNERKRSGRLSRSNSVRALRDDFFSTLPDKVRSGVDVESPFYIDVSKTKGLTKDEKKYYERQFATLESFEEVDSLESGDTIHEEDDDEQLQAERAMRISNYANILLLAFKSSFKNNKRNNVTELHHGKVDICVYGELFQILLEAVEQLIKDKAPDKLSSDQLVWMYTIMLTATVVKLALWIYCRSSGNKIVRAYAKDHYFDVITNVVGLAAAVLGDKFYWWIDPAGAILLAIYTITVWSGTVMENAVSLVGQSASPEVLQKLTYLVIRHPQVKRIDTVRAYTFGVLYFVEVDIELPEDLPLKEAHTIGETLQNKLRNFQKLSGHLFIWTLSVNTNQSTLFSAGYPTVRLNILFMSRSILYP
ncbi:hypothetical protein GH714_027134 [Hevea brasiliensis]|uniref:Uncharacterized protein n=1 Tax=Hevea brasiliensis TaxID=3981 RepID=A0A6A6MQ14_HEVBR|nr:hypothetical protein GH714_027134 [Hevea brasiliensis]